MLRGDMAIFTFDQKKNQVFWNKQYGGHGWLIAGDRGKLGETLKKKKRFEKMNLWESSIQLLLCPLRSPKLAAAVTIPQDAPSCAWFILRRILDVLSGIKAGVFLGSGTRQFFRKVS